LVDELKESGLQANHLNQNAAFRDNIPRDDGLAAGIRGNAFTEDSRPGILLEVSAVATMGCCRLYLRHP